MEESVTAPDLLRQIRGRRTRASAAGDLRQAARCTPRLKAELMSHRGFTGEVSKARGVRILNGHGGTWTSRPRALTLVKTGRARYIDERTIEFIENDHRHLAMGRAVATARVRPPAWIDGGMATLDAIAGIPVYFPVKLITVRSRRKSP